MNGATIRLECLRLAVKPGIGPGEIVEAAKVFEQYVTQDNAGKPATAPKTSGKTDS